MTFVNTLYVYQPPTAPDNLSAEKSHLNANRKLNLFFVVICNKNKRKFTQEIINRLFFIRIFIIFYY